MLIFILDFIGFKDYELRLLLVVALRSIRQVSAFFPPYLGSEPYYAQPFNSYAYILENPYISLQR